MHKPMRTDRMDRNAKELTFEELRQIWGGDVDETRQNLDKYNQTAKGIIDTIAR